MSKVKIIVENHKHEDKPVTQGAIIEVPDDVVQILVDAKIAQPVNTPTQKEGA